jgi:hypothetical protein
MKFQYKFKSGDIICSEDFHNGLCMVVEDGGESPFGGFAYTCIDLVKDSQRWRAYESSRVDRVDQLWRIATDDDIATYLTRFLDIQLGKVGEYEVEMTDNGIRIDDGSDYGVYFTVEELVQLGKLINERVVG